MSTIKRQVMLLGVDAKLHEVEAVRKAARDLLHELFPVGSRVEVFRRHGGKAWQAATVVSIASWKDGYVIVRLDSAQPWHRKPTRDFPYADVRPLAAGGERVSAITTDVEVK